MKSIGNQINSIQELPTLPTIYLRLSQAMERNSSTVADLSKIISLDQAAASKILKIANSSMYAFRWKITNISQAIFNIGFIEVKNLVLSMSVLEVFNSINYYTTFSSIELWKHSIAVAVITRNLGVSLKIKNLEDLFISGILHDIGKLFLLTSYKQDYVDVVEYAYKNKLAIRDAEIELLGIDHCEAGEMIADKWRLPLHLRKTIRHHHSRVPQIDSNILPTLVSVADSTAKLYEMGNSGDNVVSEISKEIWDALDLPSNIFTSLLPKKINEYEETLGIFTID